MAEDKCVCVVKDNWIRNCPVTVGDVRRSHSIYGPPLPPVKGRTRYQSSARVKETDIVQIPKSMYKDLKNVTLCVDFFITKGSIVKELKDIFKLYNARGFRITEIHADNESGKVEKDVLPALLVCCEVDDHVPEIERSVQTMKNDSRSTCHAMPYLCYPRMMVQAIIKTGVAFLNAFGSAKQSTNGLSAWNTIENLPHVDHNHLKYECGEYVQLHLTEKVTNTMKSRTIGAIVLDPRNLTGQYNFMSLETGRETNGRVTTAMPITDDVIKRVEELRLEQQQPYRESKMLKYEWRPGQPISADDIVAPAEAAQDPLILPEPIVINLPNAGPNPFVPIDVDDLPGADEIETELPDNQEEQGAETQGAQGAEIQGAQVEALAEDQGAQNGNQEQP
ncbi:unnamed protein product [Cylindrotheca closterium]|uniref:Uncharacterized protein n=1 Tax=Cylindrotheca closterium TaxID=2856 RepID=A0AAD2JII2_9STRA|nr:unnamed protein product [Cylindrotheca closterium]